MSGEYFDVHMWQYQEPVFVIYVPYGWLPVLRELDDIEWEWPS